MVNLDILGALKSALERGDSLERAMRSLFNASYKKEEIEEAARTLTDLKLDKQIQPVVKGLPKTATIQSTVGGAKPKTVKELRTALDREHSLKKAMLILYNSGYNLDEIIKAAKELIEFDHLAPSALRFEMEAPKRLKIFQKAEKGKPGKPEKPGEQKPTPLQPQEIKIPTIIRLPSLTQGEAAVQEQAQAPLPPTIKPIVEIERQNHKVQNVVQKVSSYEKPKRVKIKGRTIIIMLFCILGILILVEVGIFIFKQQVIDFLNRFFG